MVDYGTHQERYKKLEPETLTVTIPDRDSLLSMAISMKRIADLLENVLGHNSLEERRRETESLVHNIVAAIQTQGNQR